MWRRLWRWWYSTAYNPNELPSTQAQKGLVYLESRDPKLASGRTFDIVFLPEFTEGCDELREGAAWPLTVLPKEFPEAKITVYTYNITDVKGLCDILDQGRLQKCAEDLLSKFALFRNPSSEGLSTQPIIFFAHGFGGLVYEQAVKMAGEAGQSGPPQPRFNWPLTPQHTVFLLDTPHFGAGLAEWAIMCARRLGISQQQPWTELSGALNTITDMQAAFRTTIRESVHIRIGGCFATMPDVSNKLMLSPEWAILPDFEAIPVASSHFDMMRVRTNDKAMREILDLSRMWIDELVEGTARFTPSGYNPREVLERAVNSTEQPTKDKFIKKVAKCIEDSFVLNFFFGVNADFIRDLAWKAADLEEDPNTALGDKDVLPHMIKVSLHQQVIYCDDSSSMAQDDHWYYQKKLVEQITKITTRILPEGEGVALRFINQNVRGSSNLTLEDIVEIMDNMRPGGNSMIGTNLRSKILEPLVYSKINAKNLERPLLIFIITDGAPQGERKLELFHAILECSERLQEARYPRGSVKFMIGQIGSDPEATNFLESLRRNTDIGPEVFVTTDKLDANFAALHGNDRELDRWLIETLFSPFEEPETKKY